MADPGLRKGGFFFARKFYLPRPLWGTRPFLKTMNEKSKVIITKLVGVWGGNLDLYWLATGSASLSVADGSRFKSLVSAVVAGKRGVRMNPMNLPWIRH